MKREAWYQAPKAPSRKLTRDEEVDLVIRWRDQQDVQACAELVAAHLPYVMRVASKFRGAGMTIDDLVAEGIMGMLYAMTKFDTDRGLRLLTYATHWIHAYIRTAVTRAQSVVSGDVRARMTYVGSIRRRRAKLEGTMDEDAVDHVVAADMGMSVKRIREIAQRVSSRDASLDDPDDLTRPSPVVPNQDDDIERRQRRDLVRSALEQAELDAREHYLLTHRLMADDEDAQTLEQVGRHLGVSRERARQLEVRLKRKLHRQLRHIAA
jgi:RNA polymerase sigma-32 factor